MGSWCEYILVIYVSWGNDQENSLKVAKQLTLRLWKDTHLPRKFLHFGRLLIIQRHFVSLFSRETVDRENTAKLVVLQKKRISSERFIEKLLQITDWPNLLNKCIDSVLPQACRLEDWITTASVNWEKKGEGFETVNARREFYWKSLEKLDGCSLQKKIDNSTFRNRTMFCLRCESFTD